MSPRCHQPSTDPGALLPPIIQSLNGAFRQLEIKDKAAPKFLAFTTLGTQANSIAFATTHAGIGRYVITGLTAGPYDVLRDGAPFGNPLVASSTGHSISFSSPSGSFAITQCRQSAQSPNFNQKP